MTDKKLISHLKNLTQVAGKFAFLKPDEEPMIWYGIAESCDLDVANRNNVICGSQAAGKCL